MWLSVVAIFIYASSCLCYDGYEDRRIMARAYPAQRKIPIDKKISILNAHKFLRSLPSETHRRKGKKYLPWTTEKQSYTVFPSIGLRVRKANDYSDSHFFPLEPLLDEKPIRIKKMLPDYGFIHLRQKRAVGHAKAIDTNKTTKALKANAKDRRAASTVVTKSLTSKASKRMGVTQKRHLGGPNKNKGKNKRTSRISANKANTLKRILPRPKKKPSKVVAKNKKTVDTKNVRTRPKAKEASKKNLRSGRSKHLKNPKSNLRNRTKRNRKPISKTIKRSQTQRRGRKVNVGRRLIAGRDAMIEDYPYVVSIQKDWEHWCAGALLNPRLVITTANCVWKSERVTRLKVRAGSRHNDRGGQTARVQEMMRHPGWSIRHIPDNDVALLLLDRSIKFSHSVHGVDLPNRAMLPAFDDAWVTSWGSDRRDGLYDRGDLSLQAYQGRLMDRKKCNNITERFGVFVTHNFFCMTQAGRRSPCTRDTGAPAVSDGVLWGLASWGLRKLCGTERYPSMFTYIAAESIMNFIENATHLLMADERFYPFPDRVRDFKLRALLTNSSTTGSTAIKLL